MPETAVGTIQIRSFFSILASLPECALCMLKNVSPIQESIRKTKASTKSDFLLNQPKNLQARDEPTVNTLEMSYQLNRTAISKVYVSYGVLMSSSARESCCIWVKFELKP